MQVPLVGGAYMSRSLIASAQRSLNLFSEQNPEGSVFPFTYYPTPGRTLLSNCPTPGIARGLYAATNGILYAAVGGNLYTINSSWGWTSIGTIPNYSTQVSMVDNGFYVVIVDGTPDGWAIPLGGSTITPITDPAFYGSLRAEIQDTFFLFNKVDTTEFYTSPSEWVNDGTTPFDPLYIATKAGNPDRLFAVVSLHRNVWLIGLNTTEIWYNSGAPDFPFQIQDGAYIDQGCCAPYSIAKHDNAIMWLAQDARGARMVLRGSAACTAPRVSTHAIEAEWQTYKTVYDAVGYCYQQGGHGFYVLTFPTADKTWVYDLGSGDWHERCWLDPNGLEHRVRDQSYAFAYNTPVVCDWETGSIYALDEANYTDNGQPIKRVRGFPHLAAGGNRVSYTRFLAEMEVGTADGTSSGLPAATLDDDAAGDTLETDTDIDITISDAIPDNAPAITLRCSDTRGQSYGEPMMQSMGAGGEFLTSVQWRRLGMARDRVFELSWSMPYRTALMGAYVEMEAAET